MDKVCILISMETSMKGISLMIFNKGMEKKHGRMVPIMKDNFIMELNMGKEF